MSLCDTCRKMPPHPPSYLGHPLPWERVDRVAGRVRGACPKFSERHSSHARKPK